MSKIGWLVNDCLASFTGVITFWHNLLEWFPELIDKTNGYTNYTILASYIENELLNNIRPQYIIRNGTYFPRINTDVKQISLIQDIQINSKELFNQQLDVINNSELVVFHVVIIGLIVVILLIRIF